LRAVWGDPDGVHDLAKFAHVAASNAISAARPGNN
jgi:hypothetical protein